MAGEWLKYENQGATRRLPLNPKLANALGFLRDMGVQAEVFSGGQPSAAEGGPRTGSVRHDHGGAADVFFSQNGRRLDWANPKDTPLFQDIVRRGKAAGLTGFGAGPGYMQPGSMHVGFGSPGVWGAGGSGKNAPSWLREAFGGAPTANTSAPAPSAAPVASTADMFAPAPAAQQVQPMQAPAAIGDALPVQTEAIPGAGVGALAQLFTQQQAVAQRRQEEEAADQTRRAALFGGGLFGPFA